jgi:hypothetical protein
VEDTRPYNSPDTRADEPHLLSVIAGLCNQEPRDELALATLLAQLRYLQDQRDVIGGKRTP